MTSETLYYAAHHEGEFASPEAALTKTGATPQAIAGAIERARVNTVLAPLIPLNQGYSAMTTNVNGKWVLWRAFLGQIGTMAEAEQFIESFRGKVRGQWVIFEYTPPPSTSLN